MKNETNKKLPLRGMKPGQYFTYCSTLFSRHSGRVFVRGKTRWSAYEILSNGTTSNLSTRFDGRRRFLVYETLEAAIADAEAVNKMSGRELYLALNKAKNSDAEFCAMIRESTN